MPAPLPIRVPVTIVGVPVSGHPRGGDGAGESNQIAREATAGAPPLQRIANE